MWPVRFSTPLSEHSSSTCSTSSVPTHRRSSSRGRPAISLRTSSSASTTISLGQGSSFLVRGAALLSDDEERSHRGTFPGLSRLSDRDRRQASSASGGYAGSRTSTSSSSTTKTYAEPTVVVLARTSVRWTRPFGATSAMGAGSSPGDCAVQDSRFSGRGPRTPFEHGEGNPSPASPEHRASCCCTSSGGRAQCTSRWTGLPRRSKRCDVRGSACSRSPGSHPRRRKHQEVPPRERRGREGWRFPQKGTRRVPPIITQSDLLVAEVNPQQAILRLKPRGFYSIRVNYLVVQASCR